MTDPVPIALIDADVLVSRTREDLQVAASQGIFVACWSPWIVEEATRAITSQWYKRHGLTDEARQILSDASKVAMRRLTATFRVVDPKPPFPALWPGADPGDARVYAAAVQAGATHLVSNNTRDFPPRGAAGQREWHGIVYLTADRFLRLILA